MFEKDWYCSLVFFFFSKKKRTQSGIQTNMRKNKIKILEIKEALSS
jgi:hypothetical protein